MDICTLHVFVLVLAALSSTWAVPVQEKPRIEAKEQLLPEETGMMYSAASYLFGRWFTSATTTTTTPEPLTDVSTTGPSTVPFVRTTRAPLPPKRSRGTELSESNSSPLISLFMILFRALMDNASAPSTVHEQQQPGPRCNCPQVPTGKPQVNSKLQSSLSESAMKAVLMVVSDMLTTRYSPNSVSSTPTRTSTGFFW